eukprot:scaffold7315_cov119-Skeletonema_menzelii.AAC.5
MKPQVKKLVSPLLFLSLIVISVVLVRLIGGNEKSSMLTIDNEPPIINDNDDDDGSRTVQDDFKGSNDPNVTSYDDELLTARPTYLPTMTPTASNNVTNSPSVMTTTPIEQTSFPQTTRPITSSPSRLPTRFSSQPSATELTTSSPTKSPSPKPTIQTTQPPSKSPATSTPTLSSSSAITQLLTTVPSLSTPSDSPATSTTSSTTTTITEPDKDQINQADSSTTYHATKGCVRQTDTPSSTCIPSQHTSALAVNCCSGSQFTNNLKCKRNNCFETTSYDAAKDHCERNGMRLCTSVELDSGTCCNKGCGFNNKLSWAANSCEPTMSPTSVPTEVPTLSPSKVPTRSPTYAPTGEPTSSPTHLPTQSPTMRAGTLVNFSSGDRTVGDEEASTIGIIFEVQALRDLVITSLATFTDADYNIWSEVWIRQGRYQGKTANDDGWKRVYFKFNEQYGNSAPLNIELDNPPVFIPEGQIMSFYLVSPGKFSSDQGNVEGDVIAEDNSLRLYTGAAIDNGRWEEGCTDDVECVLPGRVFNGAISYATATMPPTQQPTPDPFEVQPSGLTIREEHWLDGHNVRRKKWHEMYGKEYKPLEWSRGLKDMAQAYADELAAVCGPTVHESYEKRKGYGENLASNTGRDEGGGSWGELKAVDLVMTRFVERESTWKPPENGHFTQVLWYATTHVGCADSVGVKPNGVVCRYQVCRYARTGNCSVKSFDDGSKNWWMKAVMQDSSNCRPFCPPEGC